MPSEVDVIFSSGETRDVELEFKNVKVQVKVKDLGWTEKNNILSKCFAYQTDGAMSFDFSKYMRMSLLKIVVSLMVAGTVVPIDEVFFARLNPQFGAMLEKLVPQAFEEVKTNDFFVKKSDSL